MIGQTIAHYQITAKLGQGGMGEVYRATDTKLDREVAIKVLPESFAQDKERLGRFEREAKLLASLNHPNIAGIHGLEQAGDDQALILELAEGEDLSERLKHGPLSVDEALDIGRQISEALEAAHAKGIIHRDLKPANIKLTGDGKIKVLDFGLAKALVNDPSVSPAADSKSPTLTADHTMPGSLLGTAAYMSPEQARGRPVDKRSDIWSFGVVLCECLTGERLFSEQTVTETIGAVLHTEPDWNQLPEDTPSTILLLLRKCLSKDPRRRLHDIADARVDIEQALADPSSSMLRLTQGALLTAKTHPGNRKRLTLAIASLAAVVALVALWLPEPELPPPRPVRFSVTLPPDQEFIPQQDGWLSRNLAVSPDGSELIYVAVKHGHRGLFRRVIDSLEIKEVPNTDGARFPMYSPDGEEVAFFSEGALRIVTLQTGQPQVLCAATPVAVGGCWSPDGHIYFTLAPTSGEMVQVSVATGATNVVARPDRDKAQQAYYYPQVLEPAKSMLFTIMDEGWNRNDAKIAVLGLESGRPQEIGDLTGTDPTYVTTGHLIFARDEQLLGVPFDPKTRTVTGRPFVVEPDVNSILGGQFSLSRSGHLAFQPVMGLSELVWVDEGGASTSLAFPPGRYFDPQVDPTGQFVVLQVLEDDSNFGIAIGDLATGSLRRIADDKAYDLLPLWSQDGQSIYYSSTRHGIPDVYRVDRHEDDDRALRLLPPQERGPRWACGWSRDNRLVIFDAGEVFLVGAEDPPEVEATGFKSDDILGNKDLAVHPNGEWIAYASNQGRVEPYQVYVERFPARGEKRLISIDGGYAPVWSADGNRLFFQNGRNLLHVAISLDPEFDQKGAPQILFQGPYRSNATYTEYDVDPKTNRFLMIKPVSTQEMHNQIVVVRNWLRPTNRD